MNPQRLARFARRLRWLLSSSLVLAVISSGLAHEASGAHLAGLIPCIDEASVHVDFVNLGATGADAAQLASELASSLKSAFSVSQVEAEFLPSCLAKDAYLLLYARISSLAPDVYGLGEDAYGYTVSLQTGDHVDQAYIASFYKVFEPSYATFKEELYLETESGSTVERHVVAEAHEMLEEFALTWREDNPEMVAPWWSKLGPQRLGILLSTCVVVALVAFRVSQP